MKELKWEKPELIIISRTKPEENVLQACKFLPGDGPANLFGWCYLWTGNEAAPCESLPWS